MSAEVPKKAPKPLKVGLISLGCAKNLVDAEIMLGSLARAGLVVTPDPEHADAVIVNTCSFIDAAQEESVDAILESAALRDERRPGQGLIVAGCMSQRFREELPKLLPEVDAFMGIDQVGQVDQIVRDAVARRASTLQHPKATGGRGGRARGANVKADLAEARATGAGVSEGKDSEGAPVLAGKGRKNQTKEVLKPAQAAGPIVDIHLRPTYIPDYVTPRFRLTPKHFAYVKIAEGCNHPCSFCIIPRMRGSHRSRGLNDIVSEARQLLSEGVRELNLISQDSTYYGLDLRVNPSRAIASPERFNAAAAQADAPTLPDLLEALNELPGNFWIRLLYTHPAHWTDRLISTIAQCRKVARYVDIPLQHIHENMLRRMRRETSRAYIEELLGRIRAGIPGIALRTTFIVGFPGETKDSFNSLLKFIRETRFERLGVFAYSREDGTVAGKMTQQVSDGVKEERKKAAMLEQREVSRALAAAQLGKPMQVLVEKAASKQELDQAQISSWEHGLIRAEQADLELRGRYVVARGEADAPDIDGRVYVHGRLPLGEFANVKIVGHTDYDLLAEPV